MGWGCSRSALLRHAAKRCAPLGSHGGQRLVAGLDRLQNSGRIGWDLGDRDRDRCPDGEWELADWKIIETDTHDQDALRDANKRLLILISDSL